MKPSRDVPVVAGLLIAMLGAAGLIWWSLADEGPANADHTQPNTGGSGAQATGPKRAAPVVGRDHEEAVDPGSEQPQAPDLALPKALPGLGLPQPEPDLGKLDTGGELSKTDGARAVAAFYPFAIRCLLETRQTEPHVGSRITLRLRVLPDGPGRTRVVDLDALDKGKTSAALRSCLQRSLKDVALDLGPNARGTVTAPMVLGPDNDPPPAPMEPPQPSGTEQDLPPGAGQAPDDPLQQEVVPPPGSPPPPGEFDDADEPEGTDQPPPAAPTDPGPSDPGRPQPAPAP